MQVQFLGRVDPLEKGMAFHFTILAGGSDGQRSLAGYSPSGQKESDTTEATQSSCTNAYAHVLIHFAVQYKLAVKQLYPSKKNFFK